MEHKEIIKFEKGTSVLYSHNRTIEYVNCQLNIYNISLILHGNFKKWH